MQKERQLHGEKDKLDKDIAIQNQVKTQNEKTKTDLVTVIKEIGSRIANVVNTIKTVVEAIRNIDQTIK